MKDRHKILDYDDFTIDLSYLRPVKAAKLNDFYSKIELRSGLGCRQYDGIRLSPLGYVNNIDDFRQSELLVDDDDFCSRIVSSDSKGKVKKLSGKTLYAGFLRDVWGHFLLGSLSRLWPLAIPDFIKDIKHILFFAESSKSGNLRGNALEIMKILGIEDKVVIVSARDVLAETLVVPEVSFICDKYCSVEFRQLFDMVRETIIRRSSSLTALPEKVFLTRSALKNATKNEVNVLAIDNFFADNGYEVISPEKLSLSQLVVLLENAGTIASVSGSVAHNIAFISPKAERKIILIERHPMINIFQANINLMCRLNAVHVDANFLPLFATSAGSVFIYGLTRQLQDFIHDYGYDKEAFAGTDTESSKRRQLAKYLRRYRSVYGYAPSIKWWEFDYADCMAEAVADTRTHFSRWLVDRLPLFPADYFSPKPLYRYLRSLFKGK